MKPCQTGLPAVDFAPGPATCQWHDKGFKKLATAVQFQGGYDIIRLTTVANSAKKKEKGRDFT